MNVLLIDPPFYEEVAHGKEKKTGIRLVQNVIPSLGLGYLAAVSERDSHKVKIIDCTLDITHERLGEILKKETTKPDVVGITATTPTFGSATVVARIVREVFKDALIVIGGVHVTSLP